MTRAPKQAMRFSPGYVRRAKAVITHARSLRWLAQPAPAQPDGLRILFYHRVCDESDPLTVRVRRFRSQMYSLAERGFRALDVVGANRRLEADPESVSRGQERVIGLSFDDGYRDVAENALPVLEELGFSATVFVVTGAVDGWVRLSWYDRQPRLLEWPEIERLDADSPLSFEAHSRTHPNLLALPEGAVRAEVAGSKAILEAHLNRPVRAFCYPGGLFGGRERRLAADAGFEVAVSASPGTNTAGSDPLALRRIGVDPSDHLFDFLAKVRGGHDTELPLRAPYRRLRYGAARRPGDRGDSEPAPELIGRFHS